MIKLKLLIVTINFFLLFVQCSNKDENDQFDVIASRLVVEHVIKERKDCIFTNIYIYILVINKSDLPIAVNISDNPDACEQDLNETNLWYKNDIERVKLGVVNFKKGKYYIEPNDSFALKCQIMKRFYGTNLEKILSINKKFINGNWLIESNNLINDTSFCIHKSEDYQLQLKLDNELVNENDSVKMKEELQINWENIREVLDSLSR
jgi:hypothetical protein